MWVMEERVRSLEELWQDYLFLTQEIIKMIEQKNIDMVLELVEQRRVLQELVEANPDSSFNQSARGQELLQEIERESCLAAAKMNYVYNHTVHHRKASQAYEGISNDHAGWSVDWSR